MLRTHKHTNFFSIASFQNDARARNSLQLKIERRSRKNEPRHWVAATIAADAAATAVAAILFGGRNLCVTMCAMYICIIVSKHRWMNKTETTTEKNGHSMFAIYMHFLRAQMILRKTDFALFPTKKMNFFFWLVRCIEQRKRWIENVRRDRERERCVIASAGQIKSWKMIAISRSSHASDCLVCHLTEEKKTKKCSP